LRGHRKDVFHMALEQSQQQFAAAESIGYESRPLNLFYGLAQAGRAISAASPKLGGGRNRPDDRQVWNPHGGHGLTFETTLDQSLGFLGSKVRVTPNSTDAFSRASIPLNSPTDVVEVEIAALLAQLPEIAWRHGEVLDRTPMLTPMGIERQGTAEPKEWATFGIDLGPFDPDEPNAQQIEERMRNYPALDVATPTLWMGADPLRNHNPGWVNIDIQAGDSARRDRLNNDYVLSGSREYRGMSALFPRAGESQQDLHPLATWWLILFSLSMLARYSPRDWSQTMDIRQSATAPIIEFVLDTALGSVPELIASSIRDLHY
jgi:hypothetical protein